jgi:hydroxyacylglutathione hydrolase
MSIPELAAALDRGGAVDVLDVRADGEWNDGHIEGALHVHGGVVEDRLGDIPRNGRPLAVICGSGYRSTVAASVLKRAGFGDVRNVPGGMRGWRSAGLPVVR